MPSSDCSRDKEFITIFNTSQVQALPVSCLDIRRATCRDPILSKIFHYVQKGWPQEVGQELQMYANRKTELSIESGCLLWGIRVVVPRSLQKQVLQSLHWNHLGISRMKAIAIVIFGGMGWIKILK